MCYQPDVTAQMKAFDDALLDLFKTWAALAAEYFDGPDIGPQDWDAAFLQKINNRVPELKKSPGYRRLIRLLDALAGPAPEAAPGHVESPR